MAYSALLALALLAGCAGTRTYEHPTKAQSDFDGDLYACEVDAAPATNPGVRDQMMDRCMRVKGWQPR